MSVEQLTMEISHPVTIALEAPHPLVTKTLTVIDLVDADEHTVQTDMTEFTESLGDLTISSSDEETSESSHDEDYVTTTAVTEETSVMVSPPSTDSTSSRSRRGSILKRATSEPLYIKESRRSWKCLPQPNLDLIRQMSELSASGKEDEDNHQESPRERSVSFAHVLVRSYSQTLGDNPSVHYGPPITLDWQYEEYEPMCVDHYEEKRAPRRSIRQLILSYYQRQNLLTWQYGITEEELESAKKEVKREKLRRNITCTLLPVMHVEAALESAGRKARRMMAKQKDNTSS